MPHTSLLSVRVDDMFAWRGTLPHSASILSGARGVLRWLKHITAAAMPLVLRDVLLKLVQRDVDDVRISYETGRCDNWAMCCFK